MYVLPAAWASFSIPPPFWWWRQWSLSLMANDIKLWSAFMSSHVNWMLGLVKVVIVSKVNDSGCCERVRPALKVPLDGKYINPLERPPHTHILTQLAHANLVQLSFLPTDSLSFFCLPLFFSMQVIYRFILLNICISEMNFREAWLTHPRELLIYTDEMIAFGMTSSRWLKRKLSWFFLMRLFVLGTNILLCL